MTTRTLLIAFDLADPAANRHDLVDTIMSLGEAWARPLETVWVLRTKRSAPEIEAHLAHLVGDDDGLLVQETRGEARLANAGLRWFRPRRRPGMEGEAASVTERGDVVAFPRTGDGAMNEAA